MREVGIRILKDNLSSYLKLVKNGEIIYVKDRNKIIAEIRQPNVEGISDEKFKNYIQEQSLKGNIRKAKQSTISNETIKKIKNTNLGKNKEEWKNIYNETREDRLF